MAGVTLEVVFEPLNDLDDPAAVVRARPALPLVDYASRAELARSVDTMESGF